MIHISYQTEITKQTNFYLFFIILPLGFVYMARFKIF